MMNKTLKKMMLLTAAFTAVTAFAGCGTAKEQPKTTQETETDAADNADNTDSADDAESADNTDAADNTDPADNADAADNADNADATDNANSSDSIFASMDTVTLDGEKADASVFAENKVTLVNFWNIGCTPCVEELPILDQLNKEFEGKGAAIMGLYFASPEYLEQEREDIEEILSKAGAEYPHLTLSQEMSDSAAIQSVQAFPTTFVVDSNGNIVNKVEGSNDYDGWKAFIEEELKKAEANE